MAPSARITDVAKNLSFERTSHGRQEKREGDKQVERRWSPSATVPCFAVFFFISSSILCILVIFSFLVSACYRPAAEFGAPRRARGAEDGIASAAPGWPFSFLPVQPVRASFLLGDHKTRKLSTDRKRRQREGDISVAWPCTIRTWHSVRSFQGCLLC